MYGFSMVSIYLAPYLYAHLNFKYFGPAALSDESDSRPECPAASQGRSGRSFPVFG